MSRGLGIQQRAALGIVERRPQGILTTEIAGLLDLRPNRSRAVIASLVARGLVVVVHEGRQRRAYTPELLRRLIENRALLAHLLDEWRSTSSGAHRCPTCGQSVPRHLRAV